MARHIERSIAAAGVGAGVIQGEARAAHPLGLHQVLEHHRLRQLVARGGVLSCDAGACLVRQGQLATFVFGVTQGAVMLSRVGSDGRRQVVGFLLQGDVLGLAEGAAYDLEARALTHVQACRFPRRAFRHLLFEAPSLERTLRAHASDELRVARTHLTLLRRKTAMERVCGFLLDLAERQAHVDGAFGRVDLPMTRGDIADHLSLTTGTVGRSSSVLRRLKAIRPTAGGVDLLRPGLLRDLSGAP